MRLTHSRSCGFPEAIIYVPQVTLSFLEANAIAEITDALRVCRACRCRGDRGRAPYGHELRAALDHVASILNKENTPCCEKAEWVVFQEIWRIVNSNVPIHRKHTETRRGLIERYGNPSPDELSTGQERATRSNAKPGLEVDVLDIRETFTKSGVIWQAAED